jgi:hypothetical protein
VRRNFLTSAYRQQYRCSVRDAVDSDISNFDKLLIHKVE